MYCKIYTVYCKKIALTVLTYLLPIMLSSTKNLVKPSAVSVCSRRAELEEQYFNYMQMVIRSSELFIAFAELPDETNISTKCMERRREREREREGKRKKERE